MTNAFMFGAMGATGVPMTGTLVTIDGQLLMAVGLMGLCIGGVLLSAAMHRWRRRRRLVVRPLSLGRVAA